MNTLYKYSLIFLYYLIPFDDSVFPQTEDVGLLLERNPTIKITDSLNYLVHNGTTKLFEDAIEGGAIDYYGGVVDSVLFRVLLKNQWLPWQYGKTFHDKISGQGIATFLNDYKEGVKKFEFKLFSNSILTITKITIFKPYFEETLPLNRTLKAVDAHIQKPRIISREEWGAAPPKYDYTNHPYFDKLTLHHAACCGAENIDEGMEAVRGIQDFHQNGRGWNDIGYHFLVDRAGNIYQGRPETVLGAHVGGANTGNIGVCILGCYHPPEANCNQTMSLTSRDSIVKLFAWISQIYGQDPNVLLGHRDYFGTTACPGDNVWPYLSGIRSDIIELQETIELNFQFTAYPNPFIFKQTFQYDLNASAHILINIYDLLGRKVRMVVNEDYEPGMKTFSWDGKHFNGEKLPAGVYFIRSIINGKSETKKVLMLN